MGLQTFPLIFSTTLVDLAVNFIIFKTRSREFSLLYINFATYGKIYGKSVRNSTVKDVLHELRLKKSLSLVLPDQSESNLVHWNREIKLYKVVSVLPSRHLLPTEKLDLFGMDQKWRRKNQNKTASTEIYES